ncbi:hypothetical protein EST38_g6252 [Candolleomyces aberdarensis]|uniref:Carbamoyl phosphate synthase ATP-binding domain-containing protein n=1 Tax=Candolleomyces aberdarensis TaxID=2316362 RepID=A0A4Q2DL50_9AGAR|nr:hypothetical protein EST38_g6252 [Candolleomyces aberdarensis]
MFVGLRTPDPWGAKFAKKPFTVCVSRDHPVVITKYIEQAKEIEISAVVKDGMVMRYISEHIENAGVHSGGATLIHPPQDLDLQTVRQIEEATAKIGNVLNVTGPFNIQFIAKNNEYDLGPPYCPVVLVRVEGYWY